MHSLFWALLILFLVGALLRMDWVYYLAYVIGGAYLFSHWSVRRRLRTISTTRSFIDRAFVGQQIQVRLALTNSSWLPAPWVIVQEQAPLDLKDVADYRIALNVAGRSTTYHHYTLYCKRRGYFPLGPLSVSTGDLFGFAEASWEEKQPPHITVYPQIVPLQTLGLPSRIPFGVLASPQRLYEDPARLSGVRAYASGDSQRRIHWKASAHADTLLVKKFQPSIALNMLVVLDLCPEHYPVRNLVSASEWAVIVAASMVAHAIGQRQPVGLLCNGIDALNGAPSPLLPPHTGQAQLMAILSTLARVQLNNAAHDLARWLPTPLAKLEWGALVVLVAPQLDDATLWLLHQARRRGSNVIVLLCTDQPGYGDLRARAEQLGVFVHQTIWDKDLQTLGQAL